MARTAALHSAGFICNSREASTTLAARRLTSHSHGAGSVSSKSLISNSSRRSGLANPPKFAAWQSPHAWTRMRVAGLFARSKAISAAEPRKNAKGLSAMREYRIGRSSGNRPRSERFSNSMGSGRPSGMAQTPCEGRGTFSRKAFPAARRSWMLGPRAREPLRRLFADFGGRSLIRFLRARTRAR